MNGIKVYEYRLLDGWIVLAGKSDADNDYLSLKMAHPGDWWFHVRGVPGSHVVLRARTDAEPSREVLEWAAGIAAYHSKAKNAGITPVACTLARHVSKPRGAKPGTVQIKKERILKVRPSLPETD